MRLNSSASSKTPPHLGHWSISTFSKSENHLRSSTCSGQRGHKRGSVICTLLRGMRQIVCSVVAAAAVALMRSSSAASNQMPPHLP
jgi:hypothetical protein